MDQSNVHVMAILRSIAKGPGKVICTCSFYKGVINMAKVTWIIGGYLQIFSLNKVNEKFKD